MAMFLCVLLSLFLPEQGFSTSRPGRPLVRINGDSVVVSPPDGYIVKAKAPNKLILKGGLRIEAKRLSDGAVEFISGDRPIEGGRIEAYYCDKTNRSCFRESIFIDNELEFISD